MSEKAAKSTPRKDIRLKINRAASTGMDTVNSGILL